MADTTYAWPGIGGSLGKCAVCGESFAKELLLGENIAVLGLKECEQDFPVHKECQANVLYIHDWRDLPVGPLRNSFEKRFNESQQPTGEREKE